MRLRVWLLVAATLVSSFLLSQSAFAARVTQVKGKQVLIDLEGDNAGVGDKFFVLVGGKKKGLVTITKAKGGKAIGTIDKGSAQVNSPVQLARSAGGSAVSTASAPSKGHKSGWYYGALVGYSMDSQTAKIVNPAKTATDDASMTGKGFSLLGFADIPYSGNLGFIARAGFEQFSVTGNIPDPWCANGSTECKSDITYLKADAMIRYTLGNGSLVPFAAAGLGIYYPLSKSTTALGDIGPTTVLLIDGGVNFHLTPKSYIPIMVEYGYYPPSPDVSTHVIAVRAGYAMTF